MVIYRTYQECGIDRILKSKIHHRPILCSESWLLSCNSAFSFIFLLLLQPFSVMCNFYLMANKLKIYSLLIHFSSPLPSAAYKFFSLSLFMLHCFRGGPFMVTCNNVNENLRERRKFLKVNAMCLITWKDRFIVFAFFLIPACKNFNFWRKHIFEGEQFNEPKTKPVF